MPYVALRAPPRMWGGDDDDGGWIERPSMQVTEPDPVPVDTGLLDANGVRLYRVRETIAMGFKAI